jgi:hypothetical protein
MPIGQLDGTMQIAVVDPTNPTAAPQNQSAATTDNLAPNTVPAVNVGLLDANGKIDRQREVQIGYVLGQAAVADTTLYGLLTQLVDLMRAQLYAQIICNQLLGGGSIKTRLDVLAVSDLINFATANQPTGGDLTSLQ